MELRTDLSKLVDFHFFCKRVFHAFHRDLPVNYRTVPRIYKTGKDYTEQERITGDRQFMNCASALLPVFSLWLAATLINPRLSRVCGRRPNHKRVPFAPNFPLLRRSGGGDGGTEMSLFGFGNALFYGMAAKSLGGCHTLRLRSSLALPTPNLRSLVMMNFIVDPVIRTTDSDNTHDTSSCD